VQVRGRWRVSGSWVLATGRPYTAAEGTGEVWFPSGLTLTQVIFGTKNSSRVPSYHRLDLSTEREFRFGGFKSTVGVTVFNVYDRDNVRVRVYESTGSTANDLTYMGRVVNGFVRFGF
jgi:ferric enterobactin receptor